MIVIGLGGMVLIDRVLRSQRVFPVFVMSLLLCQGVMFSVESVNLQGVSRVTNDLIFMGIGESHLCGYIVEPHRLPFILWYRH